MCTIPQRKNSFLQIARRILREQTQPVDQLHVWLNGYPQIDGGLPQDERLFYHLEPSNPGPWVRYRAADDLQDGDVFITLDDDLIYPPDYIETGIKWLKTQKNAVICFGGICWDPLVERFVYGLDRWQYMIEDSLSAVHRVAFLKGQGSFFWGGSVRNIIDLSLPGFNTNDDIMTSYQLQQRGAPILCAPKPAGWIRELESSRAEHALYRRDAPVRQQCFEDVVYQKGFDPTAGRLQDYLQQEPRTLVIAKTCPPLPGSEHLDQALRTLENAHLFAPALTSQIAAVQAHVDTPYSIHPILKGDPGGRLNNISLVRAWRNWRIKRVFKIQARVRLEKALQSLKPVEVFRWQNNVLKPINTIELSLDQWLNFLNS